MTDVIRIDRSSDDESRGLSEAGALIALPSQAQLGVQVRDAVPGDLPFIDALQKKHSKAVGWMPTGQLEGHLQKGHVVIAEAAAAQPLGYCIGVDKYFKREDAGIIYQMNIEPGHQRGLLGATLLQAMFDRWPYGVRLCCCWCAQDLQANYFWEAMGFVPLAFRSGSKKRDRVHIFWQKQIRRPRPRKYPQNQPRDTAGSGDPHANQQDTFPASGHASGGTSGGLDTSGGWWFPSQTGGGAIREDRIVLPIPPGTHWSDAKPRIFPEVSGLIASAAAERKALEAPKRAARRAEQQRRKEAEQARAEAIEARSGTVAAGGLRFGPPAAKPTAETGKADESSGKAKPAGAKPAGKNKSAAPKNDPRLVAAARELRDRWLEHAAMHPGLIEQGNSAARRYDVGRTIQPASSASALTAPALIDALPPKAIDPPAEPNKKGAA